MLPVSKSPLTTTLTGMAGTSVSMTDVEVVKVVVDVNEVETTTELVTLTEVTE
jgi:hypothetical protein